MTSAQAEARYLMGKAPVNGVRAYSASWEGADCPPVDLA